MKYVFLIGAILAEIVATNALKASDSFTRLWPSLLTIAGYAAAFYLLSLTLRYFQLGVVYAIWSGVGIVLVTVAAMFLFKEKPDLPAVLGISLIIAGVVVINLFSRTAS